MHYCLFERCAHFPQTRQEIEDRERPLSVSGFSVVEGAIGGNFSEISVSVQMERTWRRIYIFYLCWWPLLFSVTVPLGLIKHGGK